MSALKESPLSETLKEEFQDEDYRYAYDEEFSNSRMATQIKVIREQQGLKQVELAELADMKQSRISALEDVNYNSWSVSTLRRIARALGVRFAFGFESWGELLPEVDSFGRRALERPKFEDDPAFKAPPTSEEEAEAADGVGFVVKDTFDIAQLRIEKLPTAPDTVVVQQHFPFMASRVWGGERDTPTAAQPTGTRGQTPAETFKASA